MLLAVKKDGGCGPRTFKNEKQCSQSQWKATMKKGEDGMIRWEGSSRNRDLTVGKRVKANGIGEEREYLTSSRQRKGM